MLDLRLKTIAWKKKSLNDLKQVIDLLKETGNNFKMLCRTAKTAVATNEKNASQLAKEYERNLDEDSEDYGDNAEAMDALEQVSNADEAFEEASAQISEALSNLISALAEIKTTVSEVKP